jgi:outer membrane lipoprotein-sorting protein
LLIKFGQKGNSSLPRKMRTPTICRKHALFTLTLLVALGGSALAEPDCQSGSAKQKAEPSKAEPEGQANDEALHKVFERMDATARKFQSVQANFVWKMYNSVINDVVECDTGKIYFQRTDDGIEMAANIAQPAPKQVIFSGGKIQIYTPRTEQVDVYDAKAHHAEFETFLVLGFGGSSEDMQKSFTVKYVGQEKIEDAETDRLELTPIAEKIKGQFPRIDLWVDPQGFSVQQKLFQSNGDYRLADYFNTQTNRKIPAKIFKLKPPAGTKTTNHS